MNELLWHQLSNRPPKECGVLDCPDCVFYSSTSPSKYARGTHFAPPIIVKGSFVDSPSPFNFTTPHLDDSSGASPITTVFLESKPLNIRAESDSDYLQKIRYLTNFSKSSLWTILSLMLNISLPKQPEVCFKLISFKSLASASVKLTASSLTHSTHSFGISPSSSPKTLLSIT